MNLSRVTLLLSAALLAGCAANVESLSEHDLALAAKQGDPQAQYLYARKLAARKAYPDAMALMKQVGDKSIISSLSREQRGDAARQVGDWYSAGLGEPRNEKLARVWWEKGSSLGNGDASYRLAQACRARHGGKLETDCIDMLETAAGQDQAAAQYELAQWLADHDGAEQEGLNWLQKSADRQNPQALYQLAQRYETGQGVEKRSDTAQRLYFAAADKGYAPAQRWMGEHTSGKEAYGWYEKAANGNDAVAQRWMAETWFTGRGVARNDQTGAVWLQKAVNNNDPQAQYLYSQRQSGDEAQELWLKRSAAGGYADAQYALAGRYAARGEEKEARDIWAALAAKGDPQARLAYGEMLRLGQGGKEDFAAAFKQYRLAANAGNRMAQYRMGLLRQEGLGAPRNRIHAYAWFSLASTDGMKEALAALNDLEAGMEPEEINRAQKLAVIWSKRIAKADGNTDVERDA